MTDQKKTVLKLNTKNMKTIDVSDDDKEFEVHLTDNHGNVKRILEKPKSTKERK
jgi:hypothetical protein